MQATTQAVESLLLATLASYRDLDISEAGLGFHGLYRISHPVKEDQNLIQAMAVAVDCMPNLLSWEPVNAKHTYGSLMDMGTRLDSDKYVKICGQYLVHMPDEEMELVRRQLAYLHLFHRVVMAQCLPSALILYVDVGGTHYTLTVDVMNMAETSSLVN